MSRIGQMPVLVPTGVTVRIDGSAVSVKGPKGELGLNLPPLVRASVSGNKIEVSRADDSKSARSMHGLARSLVANMITGALNGYLKELVVEGVGFKAELKGPKLVLALGFSSPVEYVVPKEVKIVIAGKDISISGVNKQLVGDVAARIRSFHPPEPYKGKGIKYKGEHVRRKAGKTVA